MTSVPSVSLSLSLEIPDSFPLSRELAFLLIDNLMQDLQRSIDKHLSLQSSGWQPRFEVESFQRLSKPKGYLYTLRISYHLTSSKPSTKP